MASSYWKGIILFSPLDCSFYFFIAKELYETAPLTQSQKIATLYVPFYQIVDFVALYVLAIYYKIKVSYHMRYMIATSLAVYGAALKRLFINFMGISGLNAFWQTVCREFVHLFYS
jgi:hypothetical protein